MTHEPVLREIAHHFGHDPHAGALRQIDPACRAGPTEFTGDVHRRVARAHDDHHFIPQRIRFVEVHVLMGMEFDALEVAGKGHPAGFPVMAVGHDDAVIAAPLRPLRPGKIHLKPAVGQPLDLGYGGIEGEVRANAEVIDVGFEVLQDVLMAGILRHPGFEWKVRQHHHPFGRIDMQRAIAGGQAIVVPKPPDAADATALLEAIVGNAVLLQHLGSDDAADAGADNTDRGGALAGAADRSLRWPASRAGRCGGDAGVRRGLCRVSHSLISWWTRWGG